MRFSVLRVLVILGLILGASYGAYLYGFEEGYADGLELSVKPLIACTKLLGGRWSKNGVPQ